MHGMEPLREEGGVWLLGSVAQTGEKKKRVSGFEGGRKKARSALDVLSLECLNGPVWMSGRQMSRQGS